MFLGEKMENHNLETYRDIYLRVEVVGVRHGGGRHCPLVSLLPLVPVAVHGVVVRLGLHGGPQGPGTRMSCQD